MHENCRCDYLSSPVVSLSRLVLRRATVECTRRMLILNVLCKGLVRIMFAYKVIHAMPCRTINVSSYFVTSLCLSPSHSLSFSYHYSLQTNTFQCVLATNYLHSYVFFLYADGMMRWSGEPYALIGFNAGDDAQYLTLPTSCSEAVLQITQTSNSASNIWIFRTDNDNIIQPGLDVWVCVDGVSVLLPFIVVCVCWC